MTNSERSDLVGVLYRTKRVLITARIRARAVWQTPDVREHIDSIEWMLIDIDKAIEKLMTMPVDRVVIDDVPDMLSASVF